jgi:hypothetical protein
MLQPVIARRETRVRFAYRFTVDRHAHKGLAMTRVVIFTMKRMKRLEFSLCHCEEDRMDDAAIHRASGDACGVDGSIAGSQWIATGFALAMTRVEYADRLLRASGSPRAAPSR